MRVGPSNWVLVDIDPPPIANFGYGWCLSRSASGRSRCSRPIASSKPLALLESAVESVNSDGILPGACRTRAGRGARDRCCHQSLSARLKHAIESRMRLVAAAGHDLRTPLTRMRLRAEFVADDEERALWLKDIDELQRIAHSAIQLVHEESTKTPPEVIQLG